MANLPAITTADVGIIAFWNAHDHRVNGASIDPTDCIPYFDSYTVYDNGIDGVKALGSGRNFNIRVKNDGWIVAWIDRTNTFFYPDKLQSDFGESEHKGYYDILWNWFQYTANISSTETTLSYLIDQLYNQLSNKAEFTFSATDVGHYCYEFTNANVITPIDKQSSAPWLSGAVQYTTGTTLYYASVVGIGHGGFDTAPRDSMVAFAGHTIYYEEVSTILVGAANIVAEGWMPNPLTDCWLTAGCETAAADAHGSILIIWK